MNPVIIDDFLPKFYNDSIYYQVTSSTFPWYIPYSSSGVKFAGKILGDTSIVDNQIGAAHVLFSKGEGGINSSFYFLFHPIINAIEDRFNTKINDLLRIRLGRTLNTNQEGSLSPHTDFYTPHKTVLCYVNESDGDTVFYKERYEGNQIEEFNVEFKNSPKCGQAILFDGLQYHSSGVPKNYADRITININFT
jgi:hypothetical protein